MKLKKLIHFLIHLFFVSGMLYAFYYFIETPKTNMLHRRLWAYEAWIILCFYGCFAYLAFLSEPTRKSKLKNKIARFKEVLGLNLFLLVFPWGLFLILAPTECLEPFGFRSIYWRILGIGSLVGAVIYYLPYQFYRRKISKYVLLFGFIDNLLAGLIVSLLFFLDKVPLVGFSSVPLLFYYSFFFFRQWRTYRID